MANTKQNWMGITSALALAAVTGIFGYMQAGKSNEPDLFNVVSERAIITERLLAEERELNAELQAKLSASLMQVSVSVSTTPRATIRSFLSALRLQPAWCKEFVPEEESFRMLFVNDSYERFYGVTSAKYEGKTDAEMWPENLAKAYNINDHETLREKSQKVMRELVLVDGQSWMVDFWKFYVPIPVGVDLVCGIQVRSTEYIRSEIKGEPSAFLNEYERQQIARQGG